MKKILIIEDNEANYYLMKFILEDAGYKVMVVNTGLDGVKAAQQEMMDLIIMDIQLPDINGFEATKRIRDLKKGEELPIVAITSFAMRGDKERALEAGCTGYLEKPINPDTFVLDIEQFIKTKPDKIK